MPITFYLGHNIYGIRTHNLFYFYVNIIFFFAYLRVQI